jgi:hypothetical protein
MDSSTVRPTVIVSGRVRVRVRALPFGRFLSSPPFFYSLSVCVLLLLSYSKEVERRQIRNRKKEERNLPKGKGKGKG